jgi:lipopolysaccharide cholinephosphotransferase
MKEMTLQDVQAVSLNIMKHLHDFCMQHNIKYSLGFGSLIGAIRHKGFIPWDDDMDIVMMREDFERFCKIYEDDPEFKLFSYNRGNTYAAMARLCEMQMTSVKTGSPLFTEPTGVWIDIFPLDSVDNDKDVFFSKIEAIKDIQRKVFCCRKQMREWRGVKSMVHIRSFVDWGLHHRKAWKNINMLIKQQNDLCVSFADHDSKMMSLLAFPAYIERDFSPKCVFDEVIDAPFEDNQFKIMKGYDKWLTIIYGDYMTPPPVEMQKRSHSIHKYYWK